MTFWRACPSSDWEGVMLNLMSRLAEDNLGSTVLWSQVRTVKRIYFSKGLK